MSGRPRLHRLVPEAGLPGDHLQGWLAGAGLARVLAVHLSGSGVAARIVGPRDDGGLEVAIAVAPNAAPGPRAVELSFEWQDSRRREAQGVMFHVLPQTSHGGISGIGSHLI